MKLFRGWMDKAYNRYKEFSLINDIFDQKNILLEKKDIFVENIFNQIKIFLSSNDAKNSFYINLLNFKKSLHRKREIKKNVPYIFKEESKQIIKNFEKKDKAENYPIKNNKQYNIRLKNELNKANYLTEIKKIFTFDIDNEINIIQDFLDPDPETLLNPEFTTTDKFLSMEIKPENYKDIFDEEKEDYKIYEQFCNQKISSEYSKDIENIFDNKMKKNEKNNTVDPMNDGGLIIYNLDENLFYKKLNKNNEISIPGNENSPKTQIKVKRMPWFLNDDYFL